MMKIRNNSDSLRETIMLLEKRQALELNSIKEQLYITYESIKPVNIIKNGLKDVLSSSELKGNIFNNIIGLASGYLSRKMILGNTHNPIKKIIGSILQFAIANVVSNHPESIDSVRSKLNNLVIKNTDNHDV